MGKTCSICAVAFSRRHGRLAYIPTAGHSDFLTAARVFDAGPHNIFQAYVEHNCHRVIDGFTFITNKAALPA